LLVCVTALLGIPYFSFMPVFAMNVLHVGERGLGILMAFSGLGSFLAALTIAHIGNPRRRGGLILVSGTVFFCAVIAFSFSKVYALSAVLMVVSGYAMIIMVALINTRLQYTAKEEMRGRTMSIYAGAYLGLPPLGSLFAGIMSNWVSAPRVIGAMAAFGLALFWSLFAGNRALRNLE
jgi:predicted MFS family arabinose efflux permease